MKVDVAVRPCVEKDAGEIARLCSQLGFPSTQDEIQRRLELILPHQDHALMIAQLRSGRVAGWAHVHKYQFINGEMIADLGGIIVDNNYRRNGIGGLLMKNVEQWAHESGCDTVTARSSAERKEGHLFFGHFGFTAVKQHLLFRKNTEVEDAE